ncbi:hypothetical protein HUU39_24940 [candidate division KSB1 bacterium]|nr:hypothetical protein [candidate division KSB1 bacterium]
MYVLQNAQLSAHILDPIADQARLGPRYCVGGYIYQVRDAAGRPLLSGPEFPAEFPAVINGQGLPEVFQFTLYHAEQEVEERKLIIGVGLVDKISPQLPYHLFGPSRRKPAHDHGTKLQGLVVSPGAGDTAAE